MLHFLLQPGPLVDVYNAYRATYCCVGIVHRVGDDVGLCVGIGIVGLCDGLSVGDIVGTAIVGLCVGLNVGDVDGNDSRLIDLIDDTVNSNSNSTDSILHRCKLVIVLITSTTNNQILINYYVSTQKVLNTRNNL